LAVKEVYGLSDRQIEVVTTVVALPKSRHKKTGAEAPVINNPRSIV
jgi:hypothetical protein